MKRNQGFANPEPLLALALIGMGLAVAIPAFVKARDRRRNLQALATLRAAVARYAAETKTSGPRELSDLTKEGKYLAEIPAIGISGLHPLSSQVLPLGQTDDAGGWSYSNWRGDPSEGGVWINCTHTDSRGKAWNAY